MNTYRIFNKAINVQNGVWQVRRTDKITGAQKWLILAINEIGVGNFKDVIKGKELHTKQEVIVDATCYVTNSRKHIPISELEFGTYLGRSQPKK